MKFIEHRRHAKRIKPSPHLSAEGIAVARKLGDTAGPFFRVITSPKRRAVETAVAMGYAIDETASLLKDVPKSVQSVVAHDAGFGAFYEALQMNPGIEKYLAKLRTFFESELEKIPEGGRLLIVSHGGVLEWTAFACLPEKARFLGLPLDKSEAIEITVNQGRYIALRTLRLP